MVEKMFICPSCKHQFNKEHFVGICPKCQLIEKILFLWINPKYKLKRVPKKRGRKRKNDNL
jgi:hypothetical protein